MFCITKKIFFAFIGILLLMHSNSSYAKEQIPELERNTVRIGCYNLKRFINKDPSGNLIGYGVEYLNKISELTGLKFSFVVSDNEALVTMLHSGKLDFLMPVEYEKSRLDSFTFTNYPIGAQYVGLYVNKERANLYYEDYNSFNSLRIGSVKNTHPTSSLRKYAKAHGFTYQEVLFDSLEELESAFDNKKVDAVCRSGLGNIPDTYRLIAKTDFSPFYLVGSEKIKNPLFTQVNEAVTLLQYENSNFTKNLHKKYLLDEERTIELTREEAEFIQNKKTITIAGFCDRYPILYRDEKTGELAGILKDLTDLAAQRTGLTVRYVTAPETVPLLNQIQNPEVDAVLGILREKHYFQDKNIRLSKGIENTISIAGNKDQYFSPKHAYTIAALQSALGTLSYIRAHHPNYKIITYPTMNECMRAVQDGKADAVIQNIYILSAMLRHSEFSNLTIWHSFNDDSHSLSPDYCLGQRVTAPKELISIFDKGISSLTQDDIQSVIVKHFIRNSDDITFSDFLHVYGNVIFIIFCFIIVLFIFKQKRLHELQKYNSQLIDLNKKAKAAIAESMRANKAKTDFLSRMSHDIRTPINVIIGMSYMACCETISPKVKDCLDKIKISSNFLLGLVNDILDMAKVESNKIELHPEPYFSDQFLDYIKATIEPLCDAKHIKFLLDIHPVPDCVPILDHLRINQIFFNIFSNAVKFTPEGGTITFHLTESIQNNKMVFNAEIRDTGIGISDEFQNVLFEQFSQEYRKDTDLNRGSGLGLAIVKRLMDLMHGKISVKSQIGKGTTFFLSAEFDFLPAEQASTVQKKLSVGSLQSASLKGKYVLLCEDHPLNQELIKKLLEKIDINVTVANDGKQGIEAFTLSDPGFYDAILMDIRMPVMNGIEATKCIRELDRPDARTIPIIALTASAFAEDVKKCLEAGMTGHLSKPFNPDQLYSTLKTILGATHG